MNVRSYEGLQDLYAMLDLVAEGRNANNGTYYIHSGDLQWWLFYTYIPQKVWQSNIRLWFEDNHLIGWALLSWDEFASFCIIWTDELNKIGHFEPVGTHPKFQGKGLGKSLLTEALHRLKSEKMREVSVCVNFDNQVAIRLYESVGFQKSKKLLTLSKRK